MMPGVDPEVAEEKEEEEADNVVPDSATSFVAVANSELQTPKSTWQPLPEYSFS